MNGLLRYDGFVSNVIRALGNLLLASVLWLICAVPVFTLGAASSALYVTVYRVVRKEEGKTWNVFWHSFRENFRQATVIWLICLPILVFLAAAGYNAWVLHRLEVVSGGLPLAVGLIACGFFAWCSYLFPCVARFHNTTGAMLKNCGLFVSCHLFSTLGLALLCLLEAAVFLAVPGLLPLIPGVGTLLKSYIVEHIFGKYAE